MTLPPECFFYLTPPRRAGKGKAEPSSVSPKPDFKRSAHQSCHPEPFDGACPELDEGLRINSVKGLSERFFAALRMTWPSSHIVKCTNVMTSGLVESTFFGLMTVDVSHVVL